jgi:hypothetical protein
MVAADWTNHRNKHGPPNGDREVDSLLLPFATEKNTFSTAASVLKTSKPEVWTQRGGGVAGCTVRGTEFIIIIIIIIIITHILYFAAV